MGAGTAPGRRDDPAAFASNEGNIGSEALKRRASLPNEYADAPADEKLPATVVLGDEPTVDGEEKSEFGESASDGALERTEALADF